MYVSSRYGMVSDLTRLNEGDVGGQKTLRTYWKNYFEKTDTLIWVVDATDRDRMEDCMKELHGLLLEEVCRSQVPIIEDYLANFLQRLTGASLLVFKNKSDIESAMEENEIVQSLKLKEIKTHHWRIMTCSAVTGHNLREGVDWIVKDAKERLFLY